MIHKQMNIACHPNNSRIQGLCSLLFMFMLLSSSIIQAETTNATKATTVKSSDIEEDFTEEDFTEDENVIEVSDPLESVNRAIFAFNDKAYVYVLKPIAIGYRKVVPEKGRVSIQSFFRNLVSPVRIVNAALQLKGEDASNEFARFLINTTFGFAGFFDVAKTDFDLRMKEEDFGQTLGHYGIGNGPYLVLPLFGPSTIRDGVGRIVDGSALDPLNYIFDDEFEQYLLARWIDVETDISLDRDTYEAIKRDALDPYIFLRNAYIQLRAGAVGK